MAAASHEEKGEFMPGMLKRRLLVTTILLACFVEGMASAAPVRRTEPLEVLKHGHGPVTILIIPCMSCSANAWQEFMADRVAACSDLRGQGISKLNRSTTSFGSLAPAR